MKKALALVGVAVAGAVAYMWYKRGKEFEKQQTTTQKKGIAWVYLDNTSDIKADVSFTAQGITSTQFMLSPKETKAITVLPGQCVVTVNTPSLYIIWWGEYMKTVSYNLIDGEKKYFVIAEYKQSEAPPPSYPPSPIKEPRYLPM